MDLKTDCTVKRCTISTIHIHQNANTDDFTEEYNCAGGYWNISPIFITYWLKISELVIPENYHENN